MSTKQPDALRLADADVSPPADLKCCANCKHWHKKEYIHCQCSGPWCVSIPYDENCTFEWKKVRSNAD